MEAGRRPERAGRHLTRGSSSEFLLVEQYNALIPDTGDSTRYGTPWVDTTVAARADSAFCDVFCFRLRIL